MKKYIHIIIISLCIVQFAHTQNVDKKEFVLDAAYQYTTHNDSFFAILDTLSNSIQNCIFNALGRDYYIDIDIYEDNKFRAQIFPHTGMNPFAFLTYRNINKESKGFLYYNERLVLISFEGKRWSQYDIKQIFPHLYHLDVIMYSVPAEALPNAGKALDVVTLNGFYDPITENFTVTKLDGCNGYKHYAYTILESDTWETIAKKFGTTVENIQTINNEYNPNQCLEPGRSIFVNYEIIDGVLELTRDR